VQIRHYLIFQLETQLKTRQQMMEKRKQRQSRAVVERKGIDVKTKMFASLMEEIGVYEDLTCIDIMSDARHGWRKNAKDTSFFAIGENKCKRCWNVNT